MFYLYWIPALVSTIFFMSWLSCKCGDDKSWKWFIYLFITGAILQLWPWVARHTIKDNITKTAILYDAIAIIAWTVGLMYFGPKNEWFSPIQWVGAVVVMVGLALIQKGG